MQKLFEKGFDAVLGQVELWLAEGNNEQLSNLIDDAYPQDIAEILEELDEAERNAFFKLIPPEKAAEVMEELDTEDFSEILRTLTLEKKEAILDDMADDDIVDHLMELDEKRQKEIISYLDSDDAADVRELLVYEEDTAGGIMTKDYVVLKKDYSIAKAISKLRATAPEAETIYYVFVIDRGNKLVGVISLRELIVAKEETVIEQIMNDNVIYVNVNDDQEEVARVVSKYDLLAVPVVDDQGQLQGIITVDDIIDVIEEEATEDILKFAGSSELEDIEEDRFFRKVGYSIRSRLPWLIVTIFGGLLSASVVSGFQNTLDANATLAMFMPILAGMGGNVGTQSSTLTVRAIAMGYIEGMEALRTIGHEVLTGLLVGLVCSGIVGVTSLFLGGDMMLAVIVGLAMWANMVTAATIGTIVPLVFKKVGVDPAVASAPFITTTVDITGLTIYFTLATLMMKSLM